MPSDAPTGPPLRPRIQWLILLGILVAGLALRWVHIAEISHAPDFAQPLADAGFHDYWARGLATGDWTPPPGEADPHLAQVPYLRPPGYPYFLAAVYSVLGRGYLAPRIAQAALGLLSCVLAFLLGRALLGPVVGLLTAAFGAVYWALIYFEGELQAPALIVPLVLLVLLVAQRWARRPAVLLALLTGVIVGALTLVRANVLLFIPVAVLWAVWAGRRRGLARGRAAMHAGALGLGAILAIAPATIRNAVVAGDFVLVSCNGAINLYIGNNDTSDGVTAKIPDLFELTGKNGWSWYQYGEIVDGVARHEGRPMRYSDVSAFFSRRAVDWIEGHPGTFAKLCLKRAALFWGPDEISNNKSISIEKRASPVLRFCPPFNAVLSLALVGAVLLVLEAVARRRAGDPPVGTGPHAPVALVLAALFALTYFASFVPFLAAGRFRVPLLPILFLFGAYGVHRFAGLVAARAWPRIAGAAVLWIVLLLVCGISVAKSEVDVAWWHTDRGVALMQGGHPDQAIAEFEAALAANPGYVDARVQYAEALARLGRRDEAVANLRQVLRHRPDRSELRLRLAHLLSETGHHDEAIAEARKVVESDPDLPEAQLGSGLALLRAGRFEEAAAALRRFNQLRPNDPDGLTNLAGALAGLGRTDEATAAVRRALDIDPRHAQAHYTLGNLLRSSGDAAGALTEYERAVEIDPTLIEARINIGVVLASQRRWDDAIAAYRDAIGVDPNNVIARCNLAAALANSGRLPDAITELETALRIQPGYPPAVNMLRQMRAAQPGRR